MKVPLRRTDLVALLKADILADGGTSLLNAPLLIVIFSGHAAAAPSRANVILPDGSVCSIIDAAVRAKVPWVFLKNTFS